MRPVTSVGSRSSAAWLLGLLVWLAAATAQDWRGPEDLEVRVEDAKGKALAGAEVVLDYVTRELGGPAPQLTDAKGRLAVGGLAPGIWALEVRKPGFMSFRAEVALSGGERPQIVVASQHNVPGATSTLRVRLARAKGAPAAPARVEFAPPRVVSTVAPPPAAVSTASPAATPAAPVSAAVVPAPAPPMPSPAAPSATAMEPPSAPAAAPRPVPAPQAPPTPASPVTAPTPAASPAPAAVSPAPAPVSPAPTPVSPAPAPVAPAPAAVVAAAPPARVFAAAPIARACYECRPGESALLAEAEVGAGGSPCPADLAQRLAAAPLAELPALAAGLPAGCAVLVVELPAHARYAGFRYEAAGDSGRSEDCLAGRACPAGGCRFPSEPVVRSGDGPTVVLAPFESSARRRAGFTVYWRRTR